MKISARAAVAFLFPYIENKKTWPHQPDVMYHDEWPMRHSSLLFAGVAYGESKYLDLWRRLPADSTVEEVIRNFFIRQPVLWMQYISDRGFQIADQLSMSDRRIPIAINLPISLLQLISNLRSEI